MGAAPTTVAPDRDAGRLVTAFVWVMRRGVYLTVADSLLPVGLALVFGIRVPRSFRIIGLAAGLSAATVGRWAGRQVVDLVGDSRMIWPVDVDLLDRDGAGVYACPTSRWSEWTVVDGQLRWATPNLTFGRDVDLDAREVAGTWVGSLSDPMLARVLEHLRYNRRRLESRAWKGESFGISFFAIARAMAVKTMKHVVRTFEKGALPDNSDALHVEIDSVLKDFDLNDSDSIPDKDPTERASGDGDPAPDPLVDLDQRRRQHTADGKSE